MDACGSGLRVILYQKKDDKDGVLGYASQSLSKIEDKYPALKLEFLTLFCAVTECFHKYPHGNSFEVFADNNPLE